MQTRVVLLCIYGFVTFAIIRAFVVWVTWSSGWSFRIWATSYAIKNEKCKTQFSTFLPSILPFSFQIREGREKTSYHLKTTQTFFEVGVVVDGFIIEEINMDERDSASLNLKKLSTYFSIKNKFQTDRYILNRENVNGGKFTLGSLQEFPRGNFPSFIAAMLIFSMTIDSSIFCKLTYRVVVLWSTSDPIFGQKFDSCSRHGGWALGQSVSYITGRKSSFGNPILRSCLNLSASRNPLLSPYIECW